MVHCARGEDDHQFCFLEDQLVWVSHVLDEEVGYCDYENPILAQPYPSEAHLSDVLELFHPTMAWVVFLLGTICCLKVQLQEFD